MPTRPGSTRREAHPLFPQNSRMGDDFWSSAVTPGHHLGSGVSECEQVICPCHEDLDVKIVSAGIGVVRVAQIVDGVDEWDPRIVEFIAPRRQPDRVDVVEPEVQVGDVDRVRAVQRSSLVRAPGAATMASSDRAA